MDAQSMNVGKPMTAQDEHRRHLEAALTEARERIMHAQNELAMFKPIESSSLAALRTLDEALDKDQAKSIVSAGAEIYDDPAPAY